MHYQQELSDKVSKQQVKVDDVEVEIEALCKQLLWRYFKILPGDWVYADFDGYKGSPIQLIFESVSFHDKFIHISGPNITKKGELGKRAESLAIWIRNDEHS